MRDQAQSQAMEIEPLVSKDESLEEEKQQQQDAQAKTQKQAQQDYYAVLRALGQKVQAAFDQTRVPIGQLLAKYATHFDRDATGAFRLGLSKPLIVSDSKGTMRFEREIKGVLLPHRIAELTGVNGSLKDESTGMKQPVQFKEIKLENDELLASGDGKQLKLKRSLFIPG